MSFVKANVTSEADNSEMQRTMCQAHGCPNRWTINDAKGRLCRWHHNADPMDWPSITGQIRLGMAPTVPKPTNREVPASPGADRMKVALAEFKAFGQPQANKSWAYRLKEKEAAGEPLSVAQKNAWRTALRFENDQE